MFFSHSNTPYRQKINELLEYIKCQLSELEEIQELKNYQLKVHRLRRPGYTLECKLQKVSGALEELKAVKCRRTRHW